MRAYATQVVADLHGGMSMLAIDSLGTTALWTLRPEPNSVSVALSTSFLSSASVGDVLVVKSRVAKMGRKLAFINVDISRKSDGMAIASGSHTVYFTSQ